VPSGLGLYWMTNNILTTLTTVLIRKSVQPAMATAGATDMPVVVDDDPKPQGFGRRYGEVVESIATDGTTVTIKPPGSKRSERRAASVSDAGVIDTAATIVDVAAADASGAVAVEGAVTNRPTKKKKRKKKKN